MLGFLSMERPTGTKQLLILIGAILILAIAAYDYQSTSDVIAKASNDVVHATLGPGLYVAITGGLVALVSSVFIASAKRKKKSPPAAPPEPPVWPEG